ncbi:mannose-6-phosphate isomerase, class I [Nesterenkonia natronophila]|nr:mannose-6-phosphate isomerase, class I [Nesterenkonia natronophila]
MTNPVRHYEWGSRTAVSDLFGWVPSASPQAEIWMGSHPTDPSHLETGEALTDVPFMVKVLSVDTPLSIQAHPALEQAQSGFAAEQAAQIPPNAPERSYRDPQHKPELVFALTEFAALSGFDDSDAVAGRLTQAQRLIAEGDLAIAVEGLSLEILRGDYGAAVRMALEDRTGLLSVAAEELAMRATSVLEPALADTLSRITSHFPGDPSIFVALMLHRVDLAPGQAMYVAPGTLHTYLHGVAVEVQTCSDNVLRGGLTSKRVDVSGLLKILNASPTDPQLLEPLVLAPGADRYVTEAEEFQLTHIDFPAVGPQYRTDNAGPMIVLCTSGSVRAGTAVLCPGDSVYIPVGSTEVFSSEGAQLLIAQPRDVRARSLGAPKAVG